MSRQISRRHHGAGTIGKPNNGPTGGRLSDVERGDTIIAGWDQVAVDTLALPLLGAALTEVRQIGQAARRGVGKIHLMDSELVELTTGS